ncbi:hypothetical protein LP414_10145 [Polaromonas sp. P1(28)-13]|nr:hypothetical protein LP414_10145 [Polaromonas sp. P1(28)-13]
MGVSVIGWHGRRSQAQKDQMILLRKIEGKRLERFFDEASRLKQPTPFWRLLAVASSNTLALNSLGIM